MPDESPHDKAVTATVDRLVDELTDQVDESALALDVESDYLMTRVVNETIARQGDVIA